VVKWENMGYFNNSQEGSIDELFIGRKVLFASPPAGGLTWSSVGAILDDLLPAIERNARDARYLNRFYRGDQPVLYRRKSVRPEINNKIVENRAFEVVEFKKGYEFAYPLKYTNAGLREGAEVEVLNAYARLDGKGTKDGWLGEAMFTYGQGFVICLPKKLPGIDDAPYYTDVLPPWRAFVVYSQEVGNPVLLAGTRSLNTRLKPSGSGHKEEYWVYDAYTDNRHFRWELPSSVSGGGQYFEVTQPEERANTLGIPIIEYPLNRSRLGYVEMCLHIYNAINTTDSDRVNSIEQFIQALLVLFNCKLPVEVDPDTGKEVEVIPRTGDALVLRGVSGEKPDVKYLCEQLDQSHAQLTKEDLLSAIYEITGVPDRKTRGNGGGDTGAAVVLRDGWGDAEARAKATETERRRSEFEYLKIVLKICRAMKDSEIGDLTLRDIDLSFTRNRNNNMQTKAQVLEILLRIGVNPEDAYEYCEMFPDPVAVWSKSEAYQEEQAKKQEEKEKKEGETVTAIVESDPDGQPPIPNEVT
jgi:SPP1 family phage portal protein